MFFDELEDIERDEIAFKEKFANRRGWCRHYKWGSWPAKPSLRESFAVYGFCDVEDIEAFSRIENATYNLGLPIVIRSRQGKHGTEYSVAGGPWCYRLREAMEKMKAVQE